jgi:hypothetical protein
MDYVIRKGSGSRELTPYDMDMCPCGDNEVVTYK